MTELLVEKSQATGERWRGIHESLLLIFAPSFNFVNLEGLFEGLDQWDNYGLLSGLLEEKLFNEISLRKL